MGLLRSLLAIAVLLGHAGGLYGLRLDNGGSAILPNGDTAVQTFYVASGFYMALILSGKYTFARVFWLSRYMRLAPLYIVLSLATLTISYVLTGSLRGYDDVDFMTGALAILSNITLIGQDIWMFFAYDTTNQNLYFMPDILSGGLDAAGPGTKPGWRFLMIEQGWSIGVEMWFYMLAPFLLTKPIKILVLFFALSWAVRLGLHEGLEWQADPWKYRFFPSELATFLLGSIAFRLYEKGKLIAPTKSMQLTLFVVLVGICISYPHLPGGNTEKRWIFILLFALFLPTVFELTRNWKFDRAIGELSYPIYLVHLLFLALLPTSVWTGLYCLICSIGFSILWNKHVENHVDNWRYASAEALNRRILNAR